MFKACFGTPRENAQPRRPATIPVQQDKGEDLISSPAGLWLPTTVVKRHRTFATIIWTSLLVVFFAYVVNVVREAVAARSFPSSTTAIKEEAFKLPDVAICAEKYEGCYTDPELCFLGAGITLAEQKGFLEHIDDFVAADSASLAIEAEFPNCKVITSSKLTVNQTGIDSGEISGLSATFLGMWKDNPFDWEDEGDTLIFSQVVNLYFIDAEAGPAAFRTKTVDAVLPYERVTPLEDAIMTTTLTHMLLSLTEFTGISKDGKRQETVKTFTQRSTSGKSRWAITFVNSFEVSFLLFKMAITKFEVVSIEEVDPVDIWALIGAIGGAWQYVVIAFGFFFVFAEKQPPEFKRRNFRKMVAKPAKVTARVSSASSRTSTAKRQNSPGRDDVLPPGWVTMRDGNGKTYYLDAVRKTTQWEHPTAVKRDSRGDAGRSGNGGGEIPPSAAFRRAVASIPPVALGSPSAMDAGASANQATRSTQRSRPL